MNDQATGLNIRLLKHVTEIVAAYVANNDASLSELPKLIEGVQLALIRISAGPSITSELTAEKAQPDRITKSITRDALISFIDGKPYKSLGRHLKYKGHTPETYRAKYGLPADYPLVAPSYSKRRSEISRQLAARSRR